MKAAYFEEPGKISIQPAPELPPLTAGMAKVRVHNIGICGTDISGFLGKMPFFSYPRIPGHELGVEVIEVTSDVTNVKPGDKCSVEPYMNNVDSFSSRRGHSNCCEDLQVIGVHVDGGMRPFFNIRADKLHPSSSLSYEQLALVETLAIGCHAVDRGNPGSEEKTLVIGAGPIGLSVIEFARLTGSEITVLDMNEGRLDFCKEKMGVHHTVTFKGDDSEKEAFNEITNGNGFNLVVDATGNNKSMSNAMHYLAHTGRLVYVGITTQEVSFLHPILHRKEGSILCSRNAVPSDFTRIIKLIEEGTIDTTPWITHHTKLSELDKTFETFVKPETGAIKAIIEVDDASLS